MPEILDDKSEHCVPFILERLNLHREYYKSKGEQPPPFFIGLNGVQGAGKTTLVSTLSATLSSPPYNLPTVVLSIDDLYLSHDAQIELAKTHAGNPLVQHRGEPSTHDVALGAKLFAAIRSHESDIRIPSYDKSAFSGQGDRRPESEWDVINREGTNPVEVVIFEGWCVGFRALSDAELERKWEDAKAEGGEYRGQLAKHTLENLAFVNKKLRDYDQLTDQLNAFLHMDAADTQYVYAWRLEQETALRAAKGTGMTDEQVVNFVNGYYPAYELYTDVLRNGIYGQEKGRQLRLVVGKDRRVKKVIKI